MNRPPFLLLAAVAVLLSAGCANTPGSATQNLTDDILHGSSRNPACAAGEIAHCMTPGSRINGLNEQRTCECLVRELLIQGPQRR